MGVPGTPGLWRLMRFGAGVRLGASVIANGVKRRRLSRAIGDQSRRAAQRIGATLPDQSISSDQNATVGRGCQPGSVRSTPGPTPNS